MIRALFLFIALSASAQQTPSVEISGAIPTPMTLTQASLSKLPPAQWRGKDAGKEALFEGVWLHDALKAAGIPVGSQLRGEFLDFTVVAEARDGYKASFALAELDPAFRDPSVLLAWKKNGAPLDDLEGPYRLLSTADKRGARSVRMLARLRLVRAASAK